MITARVWREKKPRYLNQVGRCKGCGRLFFPPRRVCDGCRRREIETRAMSETGRVLTYTIIRVAPPAFAQEVPYAVAVLEMDDGARMLTQVTDVAPEDIRTGMRVRLEFRKIRQHGRTGVIAYGHKAVPE